jgi:hypothetical protein
MKLAYSETPRADYPTARSAVIERLGKQPLDKRGEWIPLNASSLAEDIWPGNAMHPQGAGGAASRILKRMESEGLVRWTNNGNTWGWVLSSP